MISKVYCKILVSFQLVQNLQILDLVMAKVEKVNIALFYEWSLREHDLTFAFAFDDFKSLPQNFGLFPTGSKFANFGHGNHKSWKSQCSSILWVNF